MIYLFDLDGTLIDSQKGIVEGLKITFEEMGIKKEKYGDLLKYVGPTFHESFKKLGMNEREIEEATEIFRDFYLKKAINECNLFEGIEDLIIETSKKHKIAVATSKPEAHAKMILKRLKIDGYFETIKGSTTEKNTKAMVIREALQILKTKEAIMIGDRFSDIVGAKENGLKSIGVLYGYGSKEELEKFGADEIVERVKDLKERLLK